MIIRWNNNFRSIRNYIGVGFVRVWNRLGVFPPIITSRVAYKVSPKIIYKASPKIVYKPIPLGQ